MKPALLGFGASLLLRHGWPRRLVSTYVGLGDELMAAAALRELNRRGRGRGTWMLTRYPELWHSTRLKGTFLPWDARIVRLATRLRCPVIDLGYARYDAANDCDAPLPGHAIATLCRQLGVRGEVVLKPHLDLTATEREAGRRFERQLVVQSSAAGALIPVAVKSWPQDRWEQVVAALAGDGHQVIQLGSKREPALAGAHDLRGRTTVREAAAILANAQLFVGLVGGLMHLARSVDCPAVIVYGGREDPGLAGYSANVNLVNRPPCSPCYFRNHCPHELICMTAVSAGDVIVAARERLSRPAEPLAVETISIQ
jgi:hypothetical protein